MSNQNWTIIIFALICVTTYSQTLKKQTLSSQGSSHFVYANNKSYFLQETIGQASEIRTYEANNHSLRQGFLQPISARIITDNLDSNLQGFIYPNPFENEINIRFDEPIYDTVSITVHDILGRLVYSKPHNPSQQLLLIFNGLSSGTYVMHVQMRSEIFVAKLVRR